ncbi:type II toxin-antitoxin system PemK/MazF family toxin [Polynucleobacter sp. AM-7D1]|uniref:type II toxin-antitoxin system PemK/MazF family toxin n=1 Tax=Polynucleobacter sp. AM-7D1 TaxID=2689102 RepID=UPI001BFEC621|nr:type II toxin-antitoxin system PemK/MazF family toxin [Polynucleobacter sp. AM-7D1]QWE29669.1 type II toxin-antitoxin system PemK/MazF family toxin [Polynucleobacter sp. AM-7D1]
MVSRGDIWLINLDPTMGSEIKKTRPCIVVSPQEMHDFLRTVIIAPMTTKGRSASYRVPITHDGKKGLVLLDQIRTIDKAHLVKRLGAVSNKTLRASLDILQATFSP